MAKAGLDFEVILLPLLPEYWVYRSGLPYQAQSLHSGSAEGFKILTMPFRCHPKYVRKRGCNSEGKMHIS